MRLNISEIKIDFLLYIKIDQNIRNEHKKLPGWADIVGRPSGAFFCNNKQTTNIIYFSLFSKNQQISYL